MANVRLADYAQAKADIGLENVNNTSDANKPVSTATQAALDAIEADAFSGDYADLSNRPTLGTAAATPATDYATAAQGAKADAAAVRNTVTTVTSVAGVVNLNWALGDYFILTLTENITSLTTSNLPGAGKGATMFLQINQDAAAPKTFAWPASFNWVSGSAGVVSTALSARDLLAMTTLDNGTSWDVTLGKGYS